MEMICISCVRRCSRDRGSGKSRTAHLPRWHPSVLPKKDAEANLIARREETAAMRSQANTAKLLADNPTLMRLRELEVLEKVATSGDLKVVLDEKGLADRVVNLL